jgi:hypothetical protein
MRVFKSMHTQGLSGFKAYLAGEFSTNAHCTRQG